MKTKIQQFIKVNNEWLGLPFALLVYWLCPQLIRLVDDTAGQYDLGQLQTLSFGVVKVLLASFIAWVGSALNYPVIYRFFIGPMENRLMGEQTSDVQREHFRVKVALFIYFAYFFATLYACQTV